MGVSAEAGDDKIIVSGLAAASVSPFMGCEVSFFVKGFNLMVRLA
jgi:hypothetical protein